MFYMGNPYFKFKQFTIFHDRTAMKVTTDACLFGAWCAEEIKSNPDIATVLDIGTGTGLLALMIAQKAPVKINAVEIDEAAAQQAKENCRQSQFAHQVKVVHQDIRLMDRPLFDCIVSNPPFYEREWASDTTEKNLARHSSQLELQQLLHKIEQLLKKEGIFFLLLPYKRKKEVEQLMEKTFLYIQKSIVVKPLPQKNPFRYMLIGSKEKRKEQPSLEEIFIYTDPQHYSERFTQLLKEYYLYL